MAYQIRYPSIGNFQENVTSHGRFFILTYSFLVIFCFLTLLLWPEGRSVLINILIPGNPEITADAFSNLLNDFSKGTSPTEAIKTFCICILKGAGIVAY